MIAQNLNSFTHSQQKLSRSLSRFTVLVVVLLLFGGHGSVQSQESQVFDEVNKAIEIGDYQNAMQLLAPAVKRGEGNARTLAGLLCVHSLSGRCPSHKAVTLLSPGAEAGNSDAQYALAVALLRERPARTKEAVIWFEKAAEAGQVMALFTLGQREVASNKAGLSELGVTHIRRAAESGYAPAQLALGGILEAGIGTIRNFEEAAFWYQAAAEQGHAVAQTRIGSLYERGLGVVLDAKAADRWYRSAAESGNVEAQYSLGYMYMLGEVVEPQYFEGIYWLEQAAEAGYAKAQVALGRAYRQGIGVRQNLEEALRWFRLAGNQGNLAAQNNAGVIYEGDFYLRNYTLAAEWYERAAKAGYAHSMINLGDLYLSGLGVPESFSKAQAWYAEAAKSDDPKIVQRAREHMSTARSSSADTGIAAFGAKDQFPTAGQVFAAIVIVGILGAILSPDAGGPIDSDLQSAIDETDRLNRASAQQMHDAMMNALF